MRYKGRIATLPMPKLRLFHSRKKAAKYMRRHGEDTEPLPMADAQTWMNDARYEAVVLFESSSGDMTNDAALMAHEATHIALWALDTIGEDKPAEEELCYIVEAVTLALCDMHSEWYDRKQHKSKKKGNKNG